MRAGWGITLTAIGVTLFALSIFISKPILREESTPSVLRIGILPDEHGPVLQKRLKPFLAYLSVETGVKTQLILPQDYAELIRLFQNHEVDLAYFGGFTFVQAHASHDAIPLVMREVDTRFTSLFLVRADQPDAELADFKGKRLAFGDRLSTSGHLMPRHFMHTELAINPETFFSAVDYSGAHDKTAYRVRDGEADLGVANAEIVRRMMKDGRLNNNELRVLWETPPYSDYVWTVHDHLNEDFKTKLRDAFLTLDPANTVHRKILENLGDERFLPAGINDFVILQQTANALGLLGAR